MKKRVHKRASLRRVCRLSASVTTAGVTYSALPRMCMRQGAWIRSACVKQWECGLCLECGWRAPSSSRPVSLVCVEMRRCQPQKKKQGGVRCSGCKRPSRKPQVPSRAMPHAAWAGARVWDLFSNPARHETQPASGKMRYPRARNPLETPLVLA
jgi:hypothetical protein